MKTLEKDYEQNKEKITQEEKNNERLEKLRPGDRILFKGIDGKEKPGTIESKNGEHLYLVKTDEGKKVLLPEEALKKEELTKKVQEQEKKQIIDEAAKDKKEISKKEKAVSFSVFSRDYINGRSNGYEVKETIVEGKTKDGIHYKANIYGKELSKESIENIVDNAVKGYDGTTSRQDAAFTNDRIQEMFNDSSSNYIIYTNGSYVFGEELMDNQTLEEAENLEDFGEIYPDDDPFSDIEEHINATNIHVEDSIAALAEEAQFTDIPSFYSTEDGPDFDEPDLGSPFDPRAID